MASKRIAAFSNGLEWYWTDASPNGVITPMAIGSMAIEQLAGFVSLWQCTALPSTWVNVSAGGGGVPLSSVTASLANASIDNLAFTETWLWSTATTQKLFSLSADALTSGDILNVSSASLLLTGHLAAFSTGSTAAFTAGAVQVSGTGAHTGALMQVDTATLTGAGLVVNANTLTSGSGLSVLSTGAALTGALALFQSATTALLTNGAVRVRLTGAHTGAAMQVDTSTATGTGLLVNANALTTGSGLSVLSTSAGQTGTIALFQSATTALLANGAVRVNLTGAHTGAAVQVDTQTATGQVLRLNMPQLTTGTGILGSAGALTTGTLLDLSTNSGTLNSTLGLLRVANTGAVTNGILARLQSNSTAGSGLTVMGSGNVGIGTSAPGATLHNAGSTLFGTVVLGDFAAGGVVGTAAATVDVSTALAIGQTTGAQVLTLPAPTVPAAGRVVVVMNTGTQSFTMYGVVITVAATPQTAAAQFAWNGTAWVAVL